MGAWTSESRTNVATMGVDDFRSTEKSAVISEAGSLRIELKGDDGSTTVLRESVPVLVGEVVDASVMRVAALREFLTAQVARAKEEGVLFSVHLKATMMKVSDPIVFGHVVRAFFPKTFAKYGETFAAAGLTPNDGLGGIFKGLEACPTATRSRPPSTPSSPRARSWRWSTPTRASPTCTSPPTSSSTPPCRP